MPTDFKDILTIRKAISEIRKGLKENDADSRMSNKYIYSLIKKHAADIVRKRSDSFRILKQESFYQTINRVDLEEVPTIDPCCNIYTNCTIYRTKDRLPRMFEDSYGAIIKNVWTPDTSFEYQPIKDDSWLRKKINPWGQNGANKDIYYFYSNYRLYFPMSTFKQVKVRAYFQEDISDLNLCDGCGSLPSTECRPYMDKQLMLAPDLWSAVSDMVYRELLQEYEKITPDTNIDKNENIRK